VTAVIQPCDAGVIASTRAGAPCKPSSQPWVIAATALGSGMAFLDSTVLNVALPTIQADLSATAQDAQWVFGAYALVLAALMLVGGSLGDHYGRRRVFALGVALFAASSLWCALATGPEQLILARAAQGLGGAMMVPGSLAIIGASFEEGLRAKAIGAWSGLSGTAMAVGPVLGGFLVEIVSWRAAFLINVPLAVAALLIAFRHVPESRDPDARRLDIPGALLAAVGLGGVVYGLIRSSSAGFGDATVLVPLATGLLALAAFVFVESRSSEPMVPLGLFRSKDFDGASLFTFLFYVALTGSLYFLPFLMVQVHGYSALVAGSVFLPFVAIAFVLGRLSGRIVARFGTRLTLVAASLAAAAGFLLFALPGVGHGSYWISFFPAMVVQGFGMALVIAPLTTVALNSVEGPHSGLASGVNNAVTRVAGLLAVAVMGVFVFATFSANLDARLGAMELSPEVREAVEAEKAELGAAEPPEGVGAETAARIEEAVAESFVVGFRLTMLVSAGLALASALVAALMVGGKGSAARKRRARPAVRRSWCGAE
jgi:EmrB/QacA subfamily drug resistance transporter